MLFRFDFVFYATNLQTVTCKNHVFSDSKITKAPEPDTKADPYFRLPKQTTTVYWVDSDI